MAYDYGANAESKYTYVGEVAWADLGEENDWGNRPPKTYESNFHHPRFCAIR